MSEPRDPGDLPPGLPPEYAEAYRRGYERALREFPEEPTDDGEVGDAGEAGDEAWDEGFWSGSDEESRRERRLLVPSLLTLMAVLLLLSVFGLSRIFTDGVGQVDLTDPPPDGVTIVEPTLGASPSPDDEPTEQSTAETGPTPTEEPTSGGTPTPQEEPTVAGTQTVSPELREELGTGIYRGPVDAAEVSRSTASCRDGKNASVQNVHDGDPGTAWRCDGDGRGETITLQLSREYPVVEIGLVPGDATTDTAGGVDPFAASNRITTVRWDFSDGTTHLMGFSGDADDRGLHRIRIPAAFADEVTLEILATVSGARNTTAVSEVWIGSATG